MIKVEIVSRDKLTDGMIDCGCDIHLEGNLKDVATELANLTIAIIERYPEVMELSQKLIEDHIRITRRNK